MAAGAAVLAVCTGNICRSPFTELLLARALTRAGYDLTVASRGTRAMIGRPMASGMNGPAAAQGLDGSAHTAAQLERDDVASATLVLGLALDHRRDAVALLPRASRRTFTLLEFARLLEDAADAGTLSPKAVEPVETTAPRTLDDLAAYVAAAADRRGFAISPDDPRDDEVFDPYGLGEDDYAESAALMVAAVDRIEAVLTGAYAPAAAPEVPADA